MTANHDFTVPLNPDRLESAWSCHVKWRAMDSQIIFWDKFLISMEYFSRDRPKVHCLKILNLMVTHHGEVMEISIYSRYLAFRHPCSVNRKEKTFLRYPERFPTLVFNKFAVLSFELTAADQAKSMKMYTRLLLRLGIPLSNPFSGQLCPPTSPSSEGRFST